jgi:4-amino-4-deoxychorismate lyase
MPDAAELINGQPAEQISSHDRGLYYGDGLFETMAVVDGAIPLWQRHLARLQQGCDRLQLACPTQAVLETEIRQLVQDKHRAIVKLILTRGQGGRGYAQPETVVATRILQRHPWPAMPRRYWETGVNVIFCRQRLARQPALAGIKHLNRLEQVLARSEWQTADIQEGVLADTQGNIIEAVSHNLFMVKANTVITPDLQYAGVAGVMREYVLSWLQQQGIPLSITQIDKATLLAADTVFLCNSIHGIWPICDLDGKSYAENRLVCELRDAVAEVIPYP